MRPGGRGAIVATLTTHYSYLVDKVDVLLLLTPLTTRLVHKVDLALGGVDVDVEVGGGQAQREVHEGVRVLGQVRRVDLVRVRVRVRVRVLG